MGVDAMLHRKKKWKSKAAEVEYKAAWKHGGKKVWKNKEAELQHRKKKWKSKAAEVEYKAAKVEGKKHKWKNAEAEQAAKVDVMLNRKRKWKSKAAEMEYKASKGQGQFRSMVNEQGTKIKMLNAALKKKAQQMKIESVQVQSCVSAGLEIKEKQSRAKALLQTQKVTQKPVSKQLSTIPEKLLKKKMRQQILKNEK